MWTGNRTNQAGWQLSNDVDGRAERLGGWGRWPIFGTICSEAKPFRKRTTGPAHRDQRQQSCARRDAGIAFGCRVRSGGATPCTGHACAGSRSGDQEVGLVGVGAGWSARWPRGCASHGARAADSVGGLGGWSGWGGCDFGEGEHSGHHQHGLGSGDWPFGCELAFGHASHHFSVC